MGALTFHDHTYPTEHPANGRRTLEVTTFDNRVELRISALAGEESRNRRFSVILTKTEAAALIEDLSRATEYVYGGD